jgi:hypothetical protein
MPLNVGEPLEIKRLVPRREGFSRITDIRSFQSIPQESLFPLAPGNWIPRKDNFFDLGATGRVWKKIVVDTIEFDGGGTMTAVPGSTVTISANNTTDETAYPIFVSNGATGTQALESDTGFTYNPLTGVLTATTFAGNVTGSAATTTGAAAVATTVTITDNESEIEENAIIFTANGAKLGGNLSLESDGDLFYTPSLGKLQATYFSGKSLRLNVETVKTETPTATYGTFRYALDGGTAATDTLGFLFGQTDANAEDDNVGSSFWTMLSESDGSSGSRIIFEPIVPWGAVDGTKNRSYIGWHNVIYATYSYYLNSGWANASYPSHTFSGDNDTGMYRLSSNIIGFTAGGLSVCGVYASDDGGGSFSGGIYPTTDDRYDLGTGSYRWDDIFATSGTVNTSDSRLKENIQPAKLGLDFINDLNPITYKWKKKNKKKVDATHHGIIAQEVVETLKDYGIDSLEDFGGIYHDGDNESYYGARYNEFIPILMKAVQELSAEVKELKEKVYA